jgi:hypothetical protein
MRLFKRKKKRILVEQVSLPVLIRQVIYDSMLMPAEEIASKMGLPPISEEVSEMEERDSQARLSRMSALLPLIDAHADIAARIASAAYMIDDEDMDALPEDSVEKLTELFRLVSLASSVSCVSTLFSLGLIDSNIVEDFDE